jgi:hypothetical protein
MPENKNAIAFAGQFPAKGSIFSNPMKLPAASCGVSSEIAA